MAAIIVSKVLFVARHSWSIAYIVDQLAKATYTLHGMDFSSRLLRRARALLNADHSRVSVRGCSIGAPDIEAELRVSAAVTVAEWLTAGSRRN